MKYLKKYNEGILSNTKEFILSSKSDDKAAEKWIKAIYDDWNKHKDLYRVSIIENGEYTNFRYMITNGKQNDVQLGNRDENAITIELTYINNIITWKRDRTKARIRVEKFKSYIGELVMLGRSILNNKTINNDEGVKDDYSSYINISSGPVKKIIDFFLSKFKSEYPTMTKYYNKASILRIDTKRRESEIQKSKSDYEESRNKHEQLRVDKEKMVKSKLNFRLDSEDILDYFLEIEDDMEIDIEYTQSVYIDRIIYDLKRYKSGTTIIGEFDLDGNQNQNYYKITEIPLQKNKPYHKLKISLVDDEVKPTDFISRVEKVIKRIQTHNLKLSCSNLSSNHDDEIKGKISFLDMEGNCNDYALRDLHGYVQVCYLLYFEEV